MAVGLWGEAGIGKSHTVTRLMAQLPCRGAVVAAKEPWPRWIACLPRPETLAHWAERTLAAAAAGRTADQAELAAAVGALLGALAPFVLYVEDAHEAADERREFLDRLARAARKLRGVCIVVTSRNEPREPFVAVRCEGLDNAMTKRLLETEVGTALPAPAVDWVFAKAAGNPLYTLEFFRFLARQGFLWNDGRHWRWRAPDEAFLPATVEALIEQLITHAKAIAADGHVLEARALLTDPVDVPLWAQVAGVPEPQLRTAVVRLRQAGVFSNMDFAHPLFRDVALRALSPARYRELSRRAVDALRGDPVRAAPYIDRADLPEDEALALLEAAADTVADSATAARFRSKATLYAHGDARARLALSAAIVLQHHDLPEALRLAELALSHASPAADAVPLCARLLARSGRLAEVGRLLAELSPGLREQIQPTTILLTCLNVAGEHQEAWALWQAHPELHAMQDPELLRAVAASALAIGCMSEATALTQQGIATAHDAVLRCEFLSLQSLIAFHSGDARSADATLSLALEALAGVEAPRLRSTALLNRAAYLRVLGQYAAMGECLEQCLRLRQGSGEGKAYAFALAALAELRIEQGRYAQADDLLSEAVTTLELYGPSRFLVNAYSMASLLATSQATPLSRLTARKHAERALALARALGSPRLVREILFDASSANSYAGDAARALALAQESLDIADAAGNAPADEFRSLWALALAHEASGDGEEAVALMERASRLADASEGAIDAHKIGLELARMHGDIERARQRWAWFEERGLMNGANIAYRYFPALSSQEPTAEDAHPHLMALGPMHLGGAKAEPLRGAKRRHLMALLLEARIGGSTGVGKLTLLDELYPGRDEAKARSSLKELVRGLRAMYGARLIETTAEGYALGACTSDVEQFLADPTASLWRGPYLDGSEREGPLRDSLYAALAHLIGALVSSDPREAVRLGKILLEAEPFRLDYLAIGLRALRAAGDHRGLQRQYQAARARLWEVGEALPERWQAFLEAEDTSRRSAEGEPRRPAGSEGSGEASTDAAGDPARRAQ